VTPGFPAVWLRHNCPCPDCRDPVTGQRIIEITAIPNGIVATVTAQTPDAVEVTFAPGGHRALFSRAWLAAHEVEPEPDPRTEDAKHLWCAHDLPEPPSADWKSYLLDDAVRADCLDAVARHGFAVLRDVPAEPGMVASVAETVGYVRETNYGRVFDVRVEPDPANLAFTSREIGPHTDNPYRDPVPTLQLLHCLRDAASGGDTGLVDGFAAAATLRREDPESFGVLTVTPWPFGYRDEETELRACQPLIGLSPRGRIREVRFNNRSMLPLQLPARETAAAYAAYRAWAGLLARPRFRLNLRLAPGDCLILDNTRVLHARTAFSAAGARGEWGDGQSPHAGERHLQGCYADLDGMLSTLAVLRRRDGARP
jgi:gamma-butyrobetaine dioxygenase